MQGFRLGRRFRPRRARSAGTLQAHHCPATTPTTADLYVLHDGRGGLLTVSEASEQLRVGTWAVYRFCETGELPHIRFIDSIRIRPDDLAAFVSARRRTSERKPADSPKGLAEAGSLQLPTVELFGGLPAAV